MRNVGDGPAAELATYWYVVEAGKPLLTVVE